MDKSYGQIAYEAYSKAVGGKSWNGEPLKTWEELPGYIRHAWVTAANTVTSEYIFRTEK